MAKNLNVSLTFTANTQQAKAQMQQLQQTLSSLTAGASLKGFGQTLNSDIQQGITAAAQLKAALQNATNVNTGKLDLGKFNQQLKQSGMTIKQYANQLTALGPQGTSAFVQLTRAMQNAENPMFRLTSGLKKLGVTLANTARWQISASLLTGFTSAISGAYQYAQDLNESLNNIRIVTGQTSEQMDEFAEKANKAAKALSTSTTAYTDAALIYYQQGLNDSQVEERTNATIKLANVTGQSAQTVSEWMTAVWNNFDNGSKSLEYYADVMTALGAATASSSDEIAEGLEKFAAVADTVGLSYEYATTALATVTSQTRQSADVVGTAFKTLFARIQDLELGKTLDDGTTLGQYSEALSSVGISIKDSSGNLKDMNLILDEMGSKWGTLNKDQQVALAQQVAGIRQYTQLIALMDNWDQFQINLGVAEGAEGTLQDQADIYAESWEAAADRVKAAAESVYSDFIDDDFFIDILNFFAGLIETVDKTIDSMGGLPILLGSIASILMTIFQGRIVDGIHSLVLGFQSLTVRGREAAETLKSQTLVAAKSIAIDSSTHTGGVQATAIEHEITLQEQLNQKASQLTSFQQQIYQNRIEGIKQLDNENLKLAEQLTLVEKTSEQLKNQLIYGAESGKYAKEMVGYASTAAQGAATTEIEFERINSGALNAEQGQIALAQMMAGTVEAGSMGQISGDQIGTLINGGTNDFDSNFQSLTQNTMMTTQETEQLKQVLQELLLLYEKLGEKGASESFGDLSKEIENATEAALKLSNIGLDQSQKEASKATGKNISSIREYTNTIKNGIRIQRELNEGLENSSKATKKLNQEMKMAKGPRDMAQSVVALASSLSSTAMGLSMFASAAKSAWEMFSEGEVSLTGVLGILTSFGMALPMVINGTRSLAAATGLYNVAMTTSNGISKASIANLFEKTAAEGAEAAALLTKAGAQKVAQAAEATGVSQDQIVLVLSKLKSGASLAEALAEAKLTAATWAQVAANLGLQLSLGAILLIILAVAAAALILVGGITLIVKAIGDWYNADAIAAENAKKHAEETANAYNEVKQAYDDLKSSLEDYNKAQNAISLLKEGTVEWKQAIQESNAQILELLNKYPELAKYVDNINGRLVITDENQLKMYDEMAEKTAVMNNINQQAQLDSAKASHTANATSTVRSIDQANINEKSIRQGLKDFKQLYEEMGNALWEDDVYAEKIQELTSIDANLVEVFEKNKKAIQDLIETEQELIKREDILAQQKVDNLLYSQTNFYSNRYGKGVQEYAKKEYEAAYARVKPDVDAMQKTGFLGMWNKTDKGEAAFNEYAEIMGLENAKAKNYQWKKSGGIKFEYTDGTETKEDQYVSYEDMAKAIAEKRMVQEAAAITKSVNQITSEIVNLSQSESTSDQAIASFIEHGDLSMLEPELATTLSEMDVTDEQAKKLGYESANALITAFNDEMANYDPIQARSNILTQKAQKIDATLAAGAEELEISKEALEMYAASLVSTSEALQGEEEQAAKLAVQHYRLAKGVNELQETFKKYSEVLKSADKNSLDYYEALGAIKQQVEKTFGVKVSADFVTKNLNKIEAMANDSEGALQELQKALVSDYVLNLSIDESYKTALDSALQDLMTKAESADINTKLTLDNSQAIDAINTALRTGAASVEDIEAMFNNANLAMPEYKIAQIPHTSTTDTNTVSTVNILGAPVKIESKGTTTTTTYSDVPYFGDNPPQFDETGKMTDAGGGGSLKITSLGSPQNSDAILQYEGEGKTEREEKEHSNKKELEELDIYHEINEELETIENNLNRISKAKDRAFGAAKLKYLEKEVQLEEKALKAEKEKLKIANDRILSNQKELNKYGFSTDESGNITNYYEQLKFWTEQKQAGKITEDQLEDITNLIDTYESDLDIADELRESIEDREYRIDVELALEEVDTKVQLKVEVEDKALQRIEFQLERIQDRAYSAADAITLLGQSATSSMNKYDIGRQGIVDTILAAGGTKDQAEAFIGGNASAIQGLNLKQEHIDQISNYQDMMIEGAQEANDKWKEMHQELDDLWDEYNEDMDDAIGKLEHITSMMESYQNIIDLVGQEALGISDEVMAQFGQTMVETSQAQVEAAKQSLEMNKGFLAEYEAALADAQARGDQDAIQLWTEKVKYAMEEVQADEEALMSATIASLEAIAAERERLIDKAIEDFNKSMFGFDSMDEMRQAYEDQKKISELYLADYQKVYELSKLTRQVNQSINDTTSVKSKQALAKIQSDINKYQEDGVKMSAYELANLQRQYELELARAQLEEAQNAKSQVRLQRDSMGNWGYLYTADEEALNEAQQNYEDKVYNIIDANQKYVDETQQLIMDATAEFEERMRDINLATFANEEERAAAIKKAQDDYQAQMQFYTDQLDIVLDNNDQLYTDSAKHVAGKFGAMQLSADDLTTHYSGTWLGNLTGVFGSSGTAIGVYQELVDELGNADTEGTLLGDMASAQDAYITWIKETFVAGGLVPNLNGDSGSASSTFSDFAENVKDYLGRDEKSGARGAIKNVKDDIGKLVKQAADTTNGFPAATKAVGNFEKDSKPKLNNMYKELAGQNGNGGLNKALEDLYDWWSDIANAPDIDKEINVKVNYTTTGDSDYKNAFNEQNPPKTTTDIKPTTETTTTLTIKKYGTYDNGYGAVQLSDGNWYTTRGLGISSVNNKEGTKVSFDASRVTVIDKKRLDEQMQKANHTAAWSGEQFSTKALFNQHYTKQKTVGGVLYVQSNESDWWYKVSEAQVTKYYTEYNKKIPYTHYGIQKGQQAYQLVSYDTGGYTGEWGPEGRLAMLHQKEIILNAHDTENFLTAVQIVRSMADKLETNALLAQQGLGGVVAAVSAAAANQTLDQNVTIHAEFPNATNHAEIEEAFRNLTNLASQYANRR